MKTNCRENGFVKRFQVYFDYPPQIILSLFLKLRKTFISKFQTFVVPCRVKQKPKSTRACYALNTSIGPICTRLH